jgi:hypothetical protein
MDWIILVSLGMKIILAVCAFLGLLYVLRFMNRSIGIRFTEHVSAKLRESPEALALYFGLRMLALALLIGLVAGCTAQAAPFPTQYDRTIKEATVRWMPGVDWRLWKAQLWQESRLDPLARSPAGADGLAQFMPATAKEIWPLLGYGVVDRRLAEPSINAGAFYMARLRRSWTARRPEADRHDLAMASYNAGLGHILAAQRACGGPPLYRDIMACLPQITHQHARETLGYAPSVRRWYLAMI